MQQQKKKTIHNQYLKPVERVPIFDITIFVSSILKFSFLSPKFKIIISIIKFQNIFQSSAEIHSCDLQNLTKIHGYNLLILLSKFMVTFIWNVPVLQYDDFQNLEMIGYGDGKLTYSNSSMETWTGGNQEDNEDVAPCFQLQSIVEEIMSITAILL